MRAHIHTFFSWGIEVWKTATSWYELSSWLESVDKLVGLQAVRPVHWKSGLQVCVGSSFFVQKDAACRVGLGSLLTAGTTLGVSWSFLPA